MTRGTSLARHPVAERWEAAWAGRDPAAFDACCTPDLQYEDPVAIEPLRGIAAVARQAERLWAAFPDVRIERTAAPIREGDFACLPWRLLGTNRGELAGMPASGRFVIVHGVHYVEVLEDRVRRARGFFDLYGAAVQLGIMPARGSLGEKAFLTLRGFGLRPRS